MTPKEFIPYEQALALKELEFNEPCFGYWNIDPSLPTQYLNPRCEPFKHDWCLPAPLYQQAFRWFREKHNLRSFVDTRVYNVDSPYQWIYDYQIKMGNGIDIKPFFSGDFDSYEEAELACLIKLIEIVKGGNQ